MGAGVTLLTEPHVIRCNIFHVRGRDADLIVDTGRGRGFCERRARRPAPSRSFEVFRLPGHSPGNIGLWEESTGVLFTGDAIYDGPLIDGLPDSDIRQYLQTVERLRQTRSVSSAAATTRTSVVTA